MNAIMPIPPNESNAVNAAAEAWFASCMARVRVSGRYAEFLTVTPAIAAVFLARNPANRSLVASAVREWSDCLRAGDWEENGEAIIIADTGELNDGQHRCAAIIETQIAMPVLVVFGVSRDSRKTVDGGKKRTSGHVLGMTGVLNASLVASAVKIHINLRTGVHLNTHRRPKEIERELTAYPDLATYRQGSYRAARSFHQSTGLMAALHRVMAQRDSSKADAFFGMLAEGMGWTTTRHPVAALHKRLLENLGNKAKLPITEVAALTIKAWNAFAEGRDIATLRWTTGGESPEAFPQVR